jgi:hypothetical protein
MWFIILFDFRLNQNQLPFKQIINCKIQITIQKIFSEHHFKDSVIAFNIFILVLDIILSIKGTLVNQTVNKLSTPEIVFWEER